MRGADRLSIHWSDRARADLARIGDYIARDNPKAAARWVRLLLEDVERASAFPLSGRRVPEYSDRSDLREMLRRTYRVVYRVQADSILVV